jgi:hypothetical protein
LIRTPLTSAANSGVSGPAASVMSAARMSSIDSRNETPSQTNIEAITRIRSVRAR